MVKTSFLAQTVIFLTLAVFTGCFEYEESIIFKKGFSGTVEVNYSVPVKEKTLISMVKFLPIGEEEINKRFNKGLFSKNIRIKDYQLKVLERDERPEAIFREKARVSYKVDFNDLAQLDGVIIGSILVKKKSNTISVKREFKTISSKLGQNPTAGEKKIQSEMVRLLRDGFVLFRVYFPTSSECRSNRGEISLGLLQYKFPLLETIEKVGGLIWDYQITSIY